MIYLDLLANFLLIGLLAFDGGAKLTGSSLQLDHAIENYARAQIAVIHLVFTCLA